MKEFLIVLKFELSNYFQKKAFVVSTLIICLAILAIVFFPNIRGLFSNEPSFDEGNENIIGGNESYNLGLVDDNNIMNQDLKTEFFNQGLRDYPSLEDLEKAVVSGEIDAGFLIKSPLDYEYIVNTNEMFDNKIYIFEEVFKINYQMMESQNRGLNFQEISDLINPEFTSETRILGTDSAGNYSYTYALVFALYFIIIVYGQIVASAVAAEKSNRTMELLVTSTNTTNLIFGKIISGALAGIIQFGLIVGTGLIALRININAWGGDLDFIFDIPLSVLIAFALFGIMGYLFYAFIFGALGALVTRTEDVGTSVTPVTILLVAVFMISMIGMTNTSGIVLKIASFVPLSSFMAMFVRITMGTVSSLEITISYLILVLSTIGIGILASRIYRAGTLMYGNRLKLKDAFKLLKKT